MIGCALQKLPSQKFKQKELTKLFVILSLCGVRFRSDPGGEFPPIRSDRNSSKSEKKKHFVEKRLK